MLSSGKPPSIGPPPRLDCLAEQVHSNADEFSQLFRTISASPAISLLGLRGNWITPARVPRRFDTHFFLAVLPQHLDWDLGGIARELPIHPQETVVTADGKETVSAEWFTPSEAIALSLEGTRAHLESGSEDRGIILFPPQFYLLGELKRVKDWRELVDADGRGKSRRIWPFQPQAKRVEAGEDGEDRLATVLPGDELYTLPTELKSVIGSRHRTYVVPTADLKGFKTTKRAASGFFRVLGFERRGLQAQTGEGWPDVQDGDVSGAAGLQGVQSKI
jgi:nucleoside diphosphate-linked moiety X motif 19, mitochondrial